VSVKTKRLERPALPVKNLGAPIVKDRPYGKPSFDYHSDLENPHLILKLIPTPDSRMRQGIEPAKTIVGMIEQDFSFGVSNEYEAPLQDMGASMSKTFNILSSAMSSTGVGGDGAQNILGTQGQVLFTPRSSTFLMWTGHDRPQLEVQFNWVRLRGEDKSTIEQALEVYRTSSPEMSESVLSAPNGYNMTTKMNTELKRIQQHLASASKRISGAEKGEEVEVNRVGGDTSSQYYKDEAKGIDLASIATGTYTLCIGQWFKLSGLVVENAEVSFSAQTPSADGTPEMATVTMTLKPIITLSINELKKAFGVRNVTSS